MEPNAAGSRRRPARRGSGGVLVVVCALLVLAAAPGAGAPADLDGTFSGDGRLVGNFGPRQDADATAVSVQADGKIVIAGLGAAHIPHVIRALASSPDVTFGLARYDANGTVDRSFGGDGRVVTRFALHRCDVLADISMQADGKIVAAGHAGCRHERFALARYNTDGSLDTSFSGDGRAMTPFARGCSAEANAVAVQGDGKIVAAGVASCRRGGRSVDAFALARYRANGRLDTSFGQRGRVTSDVSRHDDTANDVVIQPDGKFVVAGTGGRAPHAELELVRYDVHGALDKAFGVGGTVNTRFTNNHGCTSVEGDGAAVQLDGRIIVVGMANCPDDSFVSALARYDSQGRLDDAFGGDGKVTPTHHSADCLDGLRDVAVQPDGEIVAAGGMSCGTGFAVTRIHSDGELDPGFGDGGSVETSVRDRMDCGGQAEAIALQRDGRIVAAGGTDCFSATRFALVRYLGG